MNPLPRFLSVSLMLCVGIRQAPAQPPAVNSSNPNVLFIAIDDLNNFALGTHPDVKTPNIDRLARRGVLFTNAHCAVPACNPSRTALLTGVSPFVSGVYYNKQD